MNTVSPINLQQSIPIYQTTRHDIWMSTTAPRSFCAFKKGSSEAVNISLVVSDIPYRTAAISKLNRVLPLTYFQLEELGDGSHKLSIHLRLRGGMPQTTPAQEGALRQLTGIDDETINQVTQWRLREHLLQHDLAIYSSVKVESLYYLFDGLPEGARAIESRSITLTPSKPRAFGNVLRGLVRRNKQIIEEGNLQQEVIQRTESVSQLQAAAALNSDIKITFSKDGKIIKFQSDQGAWAARAQAIRCIIQ